MTPPTSQGTYPRSRGKTSIVQGTTRYTGDSSPLTRGKPGDELSDLRPRGPSPLTRGKHSLAAPNAPPGGLIPAHAGKTLVSGPECSTGRAHPRSRGENAPHAVPVEFGHGSSPLTRGKLVEGARLFDVVGLIPAHAGKTTRSGESWSDPPAHPRSRGENTRSVFTCCSATGSSPLTRGKPEDELVAGLSDRLIPAHAGKTRG